MRKRKEFDEGYILSLFDKIDNFYVFTDKKPEVEWKGSLIHISMQDGRNHKSLYVTRNVYITLFCLLRHILPSINYIPKKDG